MLEISAVRRPVSYVSHTTADLNSKEYDLYEPCFFVGRGVSTDNESDCVVDDRLVVRVEEEFELFIAGGHGSASSLMITHFLGLPTGLFLTETDTGSYQVKTSLT